MPPYDQTLFFVQSLWHAHIITLEVQIFCKLPSI